MEKTIAGIKLISTQKFTADGKRIAVTEISLGSKSVLVPGDSVKVTGISKGKGFAGVVKRWGFKGGPKTHGQSDRQRSPGSIGQTTTPGRVYRGKKMAGRMGGDKVTISGLTVMAIDEKTNLLLIKGLVPGAKGSGLVLRKMGQNPKFIPLMGVGEREIKETVEEKEERLRIEQESEQKLKQEEKEAKSAAS